MVQSNFSQGFSQLRSLAFNNTPPNRCETDIVQNLPTEILIQIFGNLMPTNLMRICDDDEFFIHEIERTEIRLTCKRWNHILISLISDAYYDIRNIYKHKLEFVVPPPTLKNLDIIDSRYLHVNNCDPHVFYDPYNWNSESQINEWLNNKNLNHVKKLYLYGCMDLTADGFSNIFDQLIDLSIINCPQIRFADTLRYLDCKILLLNTIDISTCEAPCHIGRQFQLEMIQKLKSLVELRFHCRLEEKEIDLFPTTLKKLWLINGFNNQSIIDYAYRKGIKVFELRQSC
ncbi:hypothetical protein RhiirC2_867513 [Rhizophagus irregularis]|uniref:F-box domain-containing protein n=1 Tax=Rhizophagus irregularis TaxID=588596 RepID=A0A2N1N2A5_9GLOM|nr:hypothetical protein RhiirC2_867513 [Rhizophagus irregularis]